MTNNKQPNNSNNDPKNNWNKKKIIRDLGALATTIIATFAIIVDAKTNGISDTETTCTPVGDRTGVEALLDLEVPEKTIDREYSNNRKQTITEDGSIPYACKGISDIVPVFPIPEKGSSDIISKEEIPSDANIE